MAHYKRSATADKDIRRKATACQGTAMHYKTQIAIFAQFVYREHQKVELDDFVRDTKKGEHNPYDVLADFAAFLRKERSGDKKLRLIHWPRWSRQSRAT
jgi:hypothetical protein